MTLGVTLCDSFLQYRVGQFLFTFIALEFRFSTVGHVTFFVEKDGVPPVSEVSIASVTPIADAIRAMTVATYEKN